MKTLRYPQIVLFVFVLSFWSCQNDPQPKAENPKAPIKKEEGQTDLPKKDLVLQANELIYPWVDPLNVRDQPNIKGKIIATIKGNKALAFTGSKSEKNEVIVLRGMAYDEPWLKVNTKDKKEGWVFGGAVKRQNTEKGNLAITETSFHFPHFGSYDLSTWKKQGTKDEGDGDAEIIITTYQKGDQTLAYTKTDVGEYGYSRSYELLDKDNKKQKERTFDFEVNVEEGGHLLKEIVKDYTTNKQYQRQQKLSTHYVLLNSPPLMANGAWKESNLEVINK